MVGTSEILKIGDTPDPAGDKEGLVDGDAEGIVVGRAVGALDGVVDGVSEGDKLGVSEGELEGIGEILKNGADGEIGKTVFLHHQLGLLPDGFMVGNGEMLKSGGFPDGEEDGDMEFSEGDVEGLKDDGLFGDEVGVFDGTDVGDIEGVDVGSRVGAVLPAGELEVPDGLIEGEKEG